MDFNAIFLNIYSGLAKLYETVKADPSLLWLLLPVLILWTATEIYYGEYANEKFGYSSAFTGAVSLLWLSFITLQKVFSWIALIFALYALFIFYVSFTHRQSEKTLEMMASPRILYFASFLLVLFGVGGASPDLYVVLDILIIFALLSLLFMTIKKYWLAGFLGEIEAVEKAGNAEKEINR